ncbi:hypothetical protein FlaCF_2877 [Flavobacterium tructae]
MEIKNLIYSILFALGAILYYYLYKDQIKTREARGQFGLWNYGVRFSSFLVITFLVGTAVVYFLNFLNIL